MVVQDPGPGSLLIIEIHARANMAEEVKTKKTEEETDDEFLPFPGDGPRECDWTPAPYKKSALCPRNRLYLYDRTRGASRYRGFHKKPLCCVCFVPVPVYTFSPVCEQNFCCDCVGSVGCVDPEDRCKRHCLMSAGLIANVFSMILMIFACFTIADENVSILQWFPFTEGKVKLADTDETLLKVHMGFRAVALEAFEVNPVIDLNETYYDGDTLILFDDLCGGLEEKLEFFADPEKCKECLDESEKFVRFVIMGTVLTIPSMT